MKKWLTVIAAVQLGVAFAADAIAPTKSAEWSGESRVFVNEGILETSGYTKIVSKPKLSIDPTKKYRVSGEFRQTVGKLGTFHFGVSCYSADKQFIMPQNCIYYGISFTTLKSDAKAGSNTLEVVPNSDWIVRKDLRVAFNAQKDFSDLPNFDLSKGYPEKKAFNVENGSLVVTLSKPLEKDYPAGSFVRLHCGGGENIYCAGEKLKLSREWQTFTGEVSGYSYGHTNKQFRYNTKFAAIVFRLGCEERVTSRVQFRNLKLEEIK